MRFPALALGAKQATASVSVLGYGQFGQAVAALLAAGGHDVSFVGESDVAGQCDVITETNFRYSSSINLSRSSQLGESQLGRIIVVASEGTEYGAVCEDIAPSLIGGQVILLVGAAFGAAFELSHLLSSRRPELAVNIVEVGRPFDGYSRQGSTITISGLKKSLPIAGRTLNETRAGLQAASTFFPSLVPASNIIERGFSDIDKWTAAVRSLFAQFNGGAMNSVAPVYVSSANDKTSFAPKLFGRQPKAATSVVVEDAVETVMAAFRQELLSIARAFQINRLPDVAVNVPASSPDVLAKIIVEDFVILSSLARLAYVPCPVIDSVIELASVVTASDLRREARQIEDLGLIGLDAREIIEHVSA